MSRRQRRSANRTLVVLGSLGVLALGAMMWHVVHEAITDLTVYVSPDRSTVTSQWLEELRSSGFHVHVVDELDPVGLRHSLHLPEAFATEVTTLTVNPSHYVLSGYVPPAAIARMLRERPPIHGLIVSGEAVLRDEGSRPRDVLSYWSDGRTEVYMRGTALSGQ